ncbi:MAG: PAS domain S-box protein [Gemmatimonadota bacterium]|nr:MAG: PAS domain S-box protein [Gemmatimonadota bacterium]
MEAGLDKFAELVPVAIIRTDAAGSCVHVNKRWCLLTDLTRAAAAGLGWLSALHPEDRERVFRQLTEAASKTTEYVDEFRFQTSAGTARVVSARFLPLLDDKRKLSGYLGAITDITERRATEERLRRLAHDLGERVKELDCLFGISHIVEHSGGSLKYVIQATARLLPRSWVHSEVACARIVMSGLESRTENYSDTPWKQTASIFLHGEQVGVVEVCYLKEMPARDEGPFAAEERRLIDAVAERLGRVAERLQAERSFREKDQELRERLTHLTRVSVMGEMASSIAHEVNQPLTAIAAYAQACRRMLDAGMTDSALVLDVLERIGDEALRAGDIIHRLGNLVQRRESRQSDCDINELIRGIEKLALVDARLHDVELRLELGTTLPPILADGIQIQQVVLNLIRNSIDALEDTPAGKKDIVVRTTARDEAEVQVSVTDSGCGLPEDAEDKLFEPFFTTKEAGMGMGLSISRSIVTSHGGRMWFSHNPGAGATFFFTIPTGSGDDHGTS